MHRTLAHGFTAALCMIGLGCSPGIPIDVPAGFGSFPDVDSARAGTQVYARFEATEARVRIFDAQSGESLGEAPPVALVESGAIGGAWRIFAWARLEDGRVRLWTPAFDSERTLLSEETALPCASSGTVTGPLAGSFVIDVPDSFAPDDRTLLDVDPARAGLQVRAAVLPGSGSEPLFVATADSEASGRPTDLGGAFPPNMLQGGFSFAGAIFAFGQQGSSTLLATPPLRGNPLLAYSGFVECDPAADVFDVLVPSPTPDAARTATERIGRFGGTVAATAADGTVFRLVVPAGALGDPADVTLTPATAAGLEVFGEAGGPAVVLGPPGLTFPLPALLSVTPPPGTTFPAAGSFAFVGQEGAAGVELPVWHFAADGSSATIEIDHFSTAGIQAASRELAAVMAAAAAGVPEIAAVAPQLASFVSRFPDAAARKDATDLLGSLFGTLVDPALTVAAQDLVALRRAALLLARWYASAQMLGLDAEVPTGSATPLFALFEGGQGRLADATESLFESYVSPTCTGDVAGLADWIVIPNWLGANLAQLGRPTTFTSCIALATHDVAFPAIVQPADRIVTLSFQTVIAAPGTTPGGVPMGDGRTGVPEPSIVDLSLVGGEFPGGATALTMATDAAGRLSVQIDRGAVEGDRAPRLIVDATIAGAGFAPDVPIEMLEDPAAFRFVANPPAAVNVALSNVFEGSILPTGVASPVCARLTDGAGDPLVGVQTTFSLAGAGSLASTSAASDSGGTACVSYQHPAGPIPPGVPIELRAEATVGGTTGSDTLSLIPRTASIAIGVRAGAATSFTAATNGSLRVFASDTAALRGTLTGSGATPADPIGPLPFEVVRFVIDAGGGTLHSTANGGMQGNDVLAITDADGVADVGWEPDPTDGDDARILVSYPAAGAGVAATVLLERSAARGAVAMTRSYLFSGGCNALGCYEQSASLNVGLAVALLVGPDGAIAATASGSLTETRASNGPLCMDRFSSTVQATATEASYGPPPAPALLTDGQLHVTFSGTRTTVNGCDPPEVTAFVETSSFSAVHLFESGALVGWDFDRTDVGPNGEPVITTGLVGRRP